MKRIKSIALGLAAGLLLLTGCNNLSLDNGSKNAAGCGSIVVKCGNALSLDTSSINRAKVTVTGDDFTGAITTDTEYVTLSNGGASGVTVNNIPAGKNRVVTVQAYSNSEELEGVVIRAVTDISAGTGNAVTVNWQSSKLGYVYNALVEAGVKVSAFTDSEMTTVAGAVPEVHACLIDASGIASDYKSGSLKSASNYILSYGTVSITGSYLDGHSYTYHINDITTSDASVPASEDILVVPGKWIFSVYDNNTLVESENIVVKSGKTTYVTVTGEYTPTVDTSKIVVHVPSSLGFTYVWAWASASVLYTTADSWPGDLMSDSDGDGYYDYTVNASSTNIIFNAGTGGAQTADLSVSGGEWEYVGGSTGSGTSSDWSSWSPSPVSFDLSVENPVAAKVTVTSGASFTTSKAVTVTAVSCTTAKYTIDGSDPKTSSTAVSFASSVTVTVGADASVGDVITVRVYGTDGEDEATASAEFTKVKADDKPAVPTRLGAYYRTTDTQFTIWSPDNSNVTVDVTPVGGTTTTYTCTAGYTVNGDYSDTSHIYGVKVEGDLNLAEYQFKIGGTAVRDPYGKMIKYDGNQQKTNVLCNNTAFYSGGPTGSSWAGPSANIVVDAEDILPTDGYWADRPELDSRCDAIVYEVHVGDFTSSSTWGGTSANAGKFPGMVESGTTYTSGSTTVKTGLDHLKELGVTHVQIMPMYDFATKYVNSTGEIYNWGYDPVNYNVPEDRYSTCPGDYEARIREVKDMVNEFHKNGIRVVMDVVYNHTFNTEMFSSISSKYYTSSDLSGCGNSVDVSNAMVSRMVRDSLEYWAEVYNVDGFRFDLMAIFTKDALYDWGYYLNNTNEDTKDRNLLMQGEPWQCNNNSSSSYGYASAISSLANAHIGCFAGKFRETMKGSSDDGNTLGYIFSGKTDKDGDSTYWNTTVGIRGSGTGLGSDSEGVWTRYFTSNPEQAVNYLMAHDNLCFYDKIAAAGTSYTSYADAIVKFGHGILLVSQGIPFIHCGDEFLRTKAVGTYASEAHNSYMWGQEMNQIDWSLKAKNISCFNWHKDMIQFRKDNDGLRYRNGVGTTSYSGNVITYTVSNSSGSDGKTLTIVINPGSDITVSGKGTMVMNKSGAVSSTSTTCEGTGVTIFKQ